MQHLAGRSVRLGSLRSRLSACCRPVNTVGGRQRLSLLHTPREQQGHATVCSSSHSGQQPAKPTRQLARFCSACGGPLELAIPPGEVEWRHVCTACSRISYFNPKMVVGVICEHEGKILLCKRAIEPCAGKWTVPAGYMELSESSAEGAVRETWEEAGARVEVIAPYAHWDIPRIGQAYVLFRARMLTPVTFGPSLESTETALVAPSELPFDQLAFSSVSLALRFYVEDMASGTWRLHHGVIEKAEGSPPNDPASYRLRDHIALDLA